MFFKSFPILLKNVLNKRCYFSFAFQSFLDKYYEKNYELRIVVKKDYFKRGEIKFNFFNVFYLDLCSST